MFFIAALPSFTARLRKPSVSCIMQIRNKHQRLPLYISRPQELFTRTLCSQSAPGTVHTYDVLTVGLRNCSHIRCAHSRPQELFTHTLCSKSASGTVHTYDVLTVSLRNCSHVHCAHSRPQELCSHIRCAHSRPQELFTRTLCSQSASGTLFTHTLCSQSASGTVHTYTVLTVDLRNCSHIRCAHSRPQELFTHTMGEVKFR